MRKCKTCGERYEAQKGSMVTWCSPKCGYELSQIKLEKKRAKDKKADTKKRREKLLSEDLPKQKRLTQQAVNKLALKRDTGKPCISCGTESPTIQYAAGHFKTVGGNSELRYNLKNINRQCNRRCNSALSGNIEGAMGTHGQRVGIIDRFGQEHLDWIEGAHSLIKYKCHDLIEFRKEVNQIIREMEKGGEFREPSMYQDN